MSQHTREVDAVETILGEALGALHVDPNGYYRHLAQACVEAAQGVRNASVSDIVGQAILGSDFEPINPRRGAEALEAFDPIRPEFKRDHLIEKAKQETW